MKKNLICQIFGHNPYDKSHNMVTDGDYNAICTRCGDHDYYNAKEWEHPFPFAIITYKFKYVYWTIRDTLSFCPMCHKPNWYGDHTNCIPF